MTPEEYWSQDARHQDQKFYTAFCLLGAACNDYAVGIDLRNEKKLNWAATALYYSLVHCGRLACFVASGDFPRGHEELKKLFETGEVHLRNNQVWMGHFKRFLGVGSQEIQPQTTFRRDDLVRYFITSSEHSTGVQAQFQKWGQILSKAKKLREDSNYEGLLITHEHSHVSVTEAFERLVRCFSLASATVLAQTIPLMKIFVDASPRREHWYAFLNWHEEREGLDYIEDSLLNRVNDQGALIRVREFLSLLRQNSDQRLDLAPAVRQNVKIGVFGGKTSLMDDFQAKIRAFESIAL